MIDAFDVPAGTLMQVLIDGALAFDRDLRIAVWSPMLERLTGLRAAAVGRNVLELLPCLRAVGEDRRFRATLNGRSVTSRGRLYRVPETTGRGGLFDARYCPLHGADGRVVGGVAFIRDATERERAAAQRLPDQEAGGRRPRLNRSEARYRRLIEMAPDAILIHQDGRVLCANAHGYPAAAIEADPDVVLRLIHPDDRDRWRTAIEESAARLTRCACDFHIFTAWGEERWFRSLATPHRLDDGSVVWDGLGLDITELKETEARLSERERQLNEAQRIARLGHWRWAVGTQQVTWSPEIYSILGLDPEAVAPSFDAFMKHVLAEDRGAV